MTPALRNAARFAATMIVILLILVQWRYQGRSETVDLLVSGLIPLFLGIYLLLRQVPESPAPPSSRRRENVAAWSAGEGARREGRWSTILGGVLVAVGILTLLVPLLAM